jgi:hypothetical protein
MCSYLRNMSDDKLLSMFNQEFITNIDMSFMTVYIEKKVCNQKFLEELKLICEIKLLENNDKKSMQNLYWKMVYDGIIYKLIKIAN